MNRHPVDGARIILQSDEDLDLAAVVAYEHHIMLNGGGYPRCTTAARARWRAGSFTCATCSTRCAPSARIATRGSPRRSLAYLDERAGTEFDPDLVTAFIRMLRQGEAQVAVLHDEASTLAASAS